MVNLRTIRVIAGLGSLLLLTMLTVNARAAEDSSGGSAAAAPKFAKLSDGSSIELRALDDPANPWRAEYGECERWLFEHYNPDMDLAGFMAWQQGEREAAIPSGPRLRHINVLVDEHGFLYPLSRYSELYAPPPPATLLELYQQYQRDSLGSVVEEKYSFFATAVMSEAELADYNFEDTLRRSATLPPIPGWLGEEPPLWVVPGPGGEWLVQGELGMTDARSDDKDTVMLSYSLSPLAGWFRYDSEGRLLGKSAPQGLLHDWQQLYWPELAEKRSQWFAEGLHMQEVGGYIFLKRSDDFDMLWPSDEPHTLVAVYNYRGEKLDPQLAPDPQVLALGSRMHSHDLHQMYAMQLASGRTTTGSTSPHEGHADGPQRHQGAKFGPQTQLIFASGGGPFDAKAQVLRSLDDPANPYRAEYGEWDRWLYANIGRTDPQMEESMHFLGGGAARELVREAQAEGQGRSDFFAANSDNPLVATMTVGPQAYLREEGMPPRTENWRILEGGADQDGFPLPLRRYWQDKLVSGSQPYVRDEWNVSTRFSSACFSLSAGGQLSEEDFARLNKARLAAESELLPVIPQWLNDNPVRYAIVGPDGEWLTLGELGSYDPALDRKLADKAWREGPRRLCRYSPAGEQLGSIEYDADTLWPQLYEADAVGAIIARHSGSEHVHVKCWNSWIFVYRNTVEQGTDKEGRSYTRTLDSELLELYDWRGNPLPIETGMRRNGWLGHMISYHELCAYHEAQQQTGGARRGDL